MLEYGEMITIERLKNATSNGRVLNLMMLAIVLAIAALSNPGVLWLAFFPPLSVAAAYLSDSTGQRLFSHACVWLAIVPFLSILYL